MSKDWSRGENLFLKKSRMEDVEVKMTFCIQSIVPCLQTTFCIFFYGSNKSLKSVISGFVLYM